MTNVNESISIYDQKVTDEDTESTLLKEPVDLHRNQNCMQNESSELLLETSTNSK